MKRSENKVYVVTDVELGWDNVVGVFDNLEAALKCVNDRGEDINVLHEEYLESDYEN